MTDTTRRLTGFSFLIRHNVYEVIIHGKSNSDFEHLGEYISALFISNEGTPFLEILEKPSESKSKPTVSLGVFDSMAKEDFIGFMGGMSAQSGTSQDIFHLWVWIREIKNEKKI